MRLRQGGFLIAKIHQLSGRILKRFLRRSDIEVNPAQGRILFVLWEKDEISIHELAKRTSLSQSTLTNMLDRLEKLGYVTRLRSKTDRRIILIKRTEKDKRLRQKYTRVSDQMDALFYRGFTSSEIEDFEEFLRRILANLIRELHSRHPDH